MKLLQTNKGLLAVLNDFKEEQILDLIKEYRKIYPNDKRTNEELRSIVINELIMKKKVKIHYPPKDSEVYDFKNGKDIEGDVDYEEIKDNKV